MDVMEFMKYGLLGFAGALAVEILRLYELMGKQGEERFKMTLRSGVYWFMTFSMAVASGFFAWAINSEVNSASVWQIVVTGVGARTLLVKPFELRAARAEPKLGSGNQISLRDIYG